MCASALVEDACLTTHRVSSTFPFEEKGRLKFLYIQAIEAEIKQAYAGIASQVRGLAEKLEPAPARKAVKRKKVSPKKPVVAKKKPERQRGRVKTTEKVAEQTETTVF